MNIDFQEILKELEYRVPNGIINLNEDSQVTTLVDILRENGVDDANHLAQKARGYFGFINEAPKKAAEIKAVLDRKVKNTKTGNDVKVSSALNYSKSKNPGQKAAYQTAVGLLKKAGASEKDIENSKSKSKPTTPNKADPKKLGGAELVAGAEKRKGEKKDDKQLNNEQNRIKNELNNGNFNVLKKLSTSLAEERDRGSGGAGGAVPSYGENRLTTLANELASMGGYNTFVSKNGKAIQTKIKEVSEQKNLSKKIDEASQFLGLDPNNKKDKATIITYLAAKVVFADTELKRLKSKTDSLYYKEGKAGFGEDDKAVRDWCSATFDGALATNHLIKTDSNIDTSKPYTVLQADPKMGRHDDAMRAHLQDKINTSEGKDKTHYQQQFDMFNHLEFHDTYVVGKDKNDRTTLYNISNKKLNDLSDIWANTTPVNMLNKLKESFPENVSKNVVKAIEDGVEEASNVNKATTRIFSEMKIDEGFIDVVDTHLGKYIESVRDRKNPPGSAFNKWLDGTGETQAKNTAGLLKQLQQYAKTGKASYDIAGKFVTKVGEVASKQKNKIESSNSVKACIERKQNEKESARAIYDSVIKSYAAADKKSGFPDKGGNNGPHTKALIKTSIDSMHLNYMIENYDGYLGVVTGGTGSTPKDFRKSIAKLLQFDGELKGKTEREELYQMLLNKAKLNPETGGIVVVTPDGKFDLAEIAWRTAGTVAKVQHKIGKDLRKEIQNQVNERNKQNKMI